MEYSEEVKNRHLKQAGEYISYFLDSAGKAYDQEVCAGILSLNRSLQELRDTEYLFESGEKELIKVYDRYLPYLKNIIADYLKMQDSGNYQALRKLSADLLHILNVFSETLNQVRNILPQDEIDEANAKAAAEKMKAAMDEYTLK